MATLTQEAPETVATHAPLISLEGVEKVYRTGRLEYRALRGVDLTIGPAKWLRSSAHRGAANPP